MRLNIQERYALLAVIMTTNDVREFQACYSLLTDRKVTGRGSLQFQNVIDNKAYYKAYEKK